MPKINTPNFPKWEAIKSSLKEFTERTHYVWLFLKARNTWIYKSWSLTLRKENLANLPLMPTLSQERKETVSHPLFHRTPDSPLPRASTETGTRSRTFHGLLGTHGQTESALRNQARVPELAFTPSRWLKALIIQGGRPITQWAPLWGLCSGGGVTGAKGREVATNSDCGFWKGFSENGTSERTLKDKKNFNVVLNSSTKWQV